MSGNLGLRNQPGLAQGGDHGLIEHQDQRHVQSALDHIEGQEDGGQHGGHGFPGQALIDGGDEIVPQQHHGGEHDHAQGQAHNGTLLGVDLLVDEGGRAAEGGGGQDVHDEADGAGVAGEEHLQQRHDDGNGRRGHGTEDEAADADDGVLHVQLQKGVDLREQFAQQHHHKSDGADHGKRHHLLNIALLAGHGNGVDIGFGHKKYTPLYGLESPWTL